MRIPPALLMLLASSALAQSPYVIPQPVEFSLRAGSCNLTCGWAFQGSSTELTGLLGAETSEMQQRRPIDCELVIELALITPDTLLPREWHTLTIESERIRLIASSEEGLFRGSRTLVQLLEQGSETGSLPCLTITDWPRFP
ncbi:MAG TPA: glycoside hydrolase family 20 zincin-like fold domain-containing protein, partial [Flavobacteriales bacterium]|nr:glycoside hydrolase family 20 zincin-like fold domain-containing protein [Flavobacteriales bacterium]